MEIAIIHEWLTTYAGSEKVLEAMLTEFPEAEVFTLIDFLPEKHGAIIALLFGILHHPDVLLVLAIAAEVLQNVPHGGAQALEDGGDEQALAAVHLLGGDIDDVGIGYGHAGGEPESGISEIGGRGILRGNMLAALVAGNREIYTWPTLGIISQSRSSR